LVLGCSGIMSYQLALNSVKLYFMPTFSGKSRVQNKINRQKKVFMGGIPFLTLVGVRK